MNADDAAPRPPRTLAGYQDAPDGAVATAAALEDDLDLADEPLGERQENATQIIVCEGGCE